MVSYSKEAKIVVLAGLFHDIGKFYQRCIDTREKHQDFGAKYLNDLKDYFLPVFDNEEAEFEKFKSSVKNHHTKTGEYLTGLIRTGDYLSASQRVDKENDEEFKDQWNHKFLSSVFSKIQITSGKTTPLKYFKHEHLTNRNYDALIPVFDNENEAKTTGYKYTESNWKKFNDDLVSVLSSFGGSGDFDTLVNLILVLFEKYMWCIPDFTGSSETDISLFNHLKDTAAFAHAINLSRLNNPENSKLNVICGDIPGIQNYIFDITKSKAAKMLRGRSIFIQVLSRIFACKFLEAFSLSECSLIMLAGGKFYILAPSVDNFESVFTKTKDEIENYLAVNFNYELKFNAAYEEFSHQELLSGGISFGSVIESVNANLNNAKNKLFENVLFTDPGNFVLQDDFIHDDEDSNNVKCFLTEKPIIAKQSAKFGDRQEDGSEIKYNVNRQALCEYKLGEKIIKNNTVVDYKDYEIIPDLIKEFRDYNGSKNAPKVLINPDIDELLDSDKKNKLELLRNTRFIEVANYVSKNKAGETMDFEEMSENNVGAQYLCLIKGDIDNLGLVMAYGLDRDESSYNGISRMTTMSNHLKYFFSFFLNGLLEDLSEKKGRKESKIYTVFAGGDDLMLVTTQSYALELVKTFNDKFASFTCDNKEIHMTYSVT
ncbi:MAG: type III-A CRISPR-associated protein Cas10/Csm1, partial [Bacteroidetes bacterium]|nr:type III-A CRISPR-associated protein Cas10/Csm1 [Bacteroidota bacterium]